MISITTGYSENEFSAIPVHSFIIYWQIDTGLKDWEK
jgi:hypothetical protein